MSIERLMRQTVTLRRTASVARDAIGGVTPVETTVAVLGYVEPIQGHEDLADRNTNVGDWRLFLPPTADVIGWDRASWDGHTFEIVAPPRQITNPRTDRAHHWEVDLQEVV